MRKSARPEDQTGLQSAILAVPNKPLTLAYRETPLVSCLVPLLRQLTVPRAGRPAATQVPVAGALCWAHSGTAPAQIGERSAPGRSVMLTEGIQEEGIPRQKAEG